MQIGYVNDKSPLWYTFNWNKKCTCFSSVWYRVTGYLELELNMALCCFLFAFMKAPLLLIWIKFDPSIDNDYIDYKVWAEITYPFPNFNSATFEVWEWISNFIPCATAVNACWWKASRFIHVLWLLECHWSNHTIFFSFQMSEPWTIWEFIKNWPHNTKAMTTKPWLCFMGYTVYTVSDTSWWHTKF